MIIFNSKKKFFKKPFGALTPNENVCFKVMLDREILYKSISLLVIKDGQQLSEAINYEMQWIDREGLFDILCVEFNSPSEAGLYFYTFKFDMYGETKYYYDQNLSNEPHYFQMTVYDENRSVPKWLSEGVMYHIFVDRFFNSGGSKELKQNQFLHENWDDKPFFVPDQNNNWNYDFFGGDLKGIMKKLDYLEGLGITILYLSPIFDAFSNHKYDTSDYENIDPMFGTEDDFVCLCKEAKKRNIHIILDGVFSHTGSDSKYFNKNGSYNSLGAYQSRESKYYNWYTFINHPDDYEAWWGVKTLPATRELEPSFIDYIVNSDNSIIKKYLKLGADGWRIDVADELPDEFLKALYIATKSVGKDKTVIGEVWEDASNKISYDKRREYLTHLELDSVMNYPFRNSLLDFLLYRITARNFLDNMMTLCENYPIDTFYSLMNFTSTHDTPRLLTVLSGIDGNKMSREERSEYRLDEARKYIAIKRSILFVVCQFTMPGMPSVFYGDETLMQGFEDPFNRCTFNWTKTDNVLSQCIRKLIKQRKQFSDFTSGDFVRVNIGDNDILAYKRGNFLVAINRSEEEKQFYYKHDLIVIEPLDYKIINLESIYK